jgi:hypothetical protein
MPRCTHAAVPEPLPPPSELGILDGEARAVAAAAVQRGAAAEATERAVRAAAQAVTDFAWLSRGDTVLVKPVCNSPKLYPATTDPVALRAMVGLLREKGAGRVIVADMSGVQFVRFSKDRLDGSTRALMQENGLARAAEDAGAELLASRRAAGGGSRGPHAAHLAPHARGEHAGAEGGRRLVASRLTPRVPPRRDHVSREDG